MVRARARALLMRVGSGGLRRTEDQTVMNAGMWIASSALHQTRGRAARAILA